ncbi:alkaline phosphatase [uncultured Proteiniphilum sp.]|uniref:alkaline phosphatase n=1 Tax=uncultured Proteiniphilum sp. TaxID=497637 RepID=UPI002624AD4C|nr:alkaline phosphatase [uncultured Proteiniphilum sp.]
MMKIINNGLLITIFACFLFPFAFAATAQQRILIHSHNDYRQRVPFYQAYSQQVYSIEVDIFVTEEGDLLVGHDIEELTPDADLKSIYVLPIVKLFKENGGKAWKNSDNDLQLMIDLKSRTEPTLTKVVEMFGQYPEVFDPILNPNAVRVVITGNVPKAEDFAKYPEFIFFDGQINTDYTDAQLERIALISSPFFEYARWNGKGTLIPSQRKKVQDAIDKAHAMRKPIRFWGSPDGITAWNTLHTLGVDIINTDRVEKCTDFFRNFEDKNYRIETGIHNVHGMVATDRLDKTTSGFKGFDREKIQLTQGIDIYHPSYSNDGTGKKVKNIIFLIGDGMGLAQINAAETVNKGLTLLNFKNIGLQTSNPKGDYTTDSAAGGSALATGEATTNRHISMTDGKVNLSLTDYAYDKGLACGVITLGNLADATPAAFYGHATERDDTDLLTDYLLDGKLTLLAGGGMDVFTDRKDKKDILSELKKQYRVTNDFEEINLDDKKVICADGRMDLAATQGTLDILAEATRMGIEKLQKASEKGFFLMVEGAKIDYAGHANSLPGSVVETLSFDMAIAEALKFADNNGETLVVATADHETGGLTLIDGDRETGSITGYYVTDDHTPIMLPVFAYGPGSQEFHGVYRNTEIFHKMKKILGL